MNILLGHDKCWSIFNNALQSGKLHHGWILAGARGIGKAGFAKQIARKILDQEGRYTALFDAGTFPDLYVISRPPKEEPKPGEGIAVDAELKRSINIDQIRKLQSKLANKASMSDKRVIIIDAADDVERAGANALLKSLEEPPEGTIFLLISHASEKLLPTIKSRCQILRFEPLSHEQMNDALSQQFPDIADDEKSALIKAGKGSPGQAIAYMGLGMAEIEASLDNIRKSGDPQNIERAKLMKSLTLKAAQNKYEAFLRRAPSYIAEYAPYADIHRMDVISDCYNKANDLAGRAIGLSLDKQAVVFEMASLLSKLQTHKPRR